jgi:hypothetical protein
MVPQSDPPSIVTGTAEGGRLNTEAQEIVATIERVFATLGEDDQVGLKEILCDDFHAFENGVRVTSRELLDLMSMISRRGQALSVGRCTRRRSKWKAILRSSFT